jgi:hypothetical protein
VAHILYSNGDDLAVERKPGHGETLSSVAAVPTGPTEPEIHPRERNARC